MPLQWVAEQSKVLLEQKRKHKQDEEVNYWGKDKFFDRWWIILTRIAWCLEQANEWNKDIENEYQKEYFEKHFGNKEDELPQFKISQEEPRLYELVTFEVDPRLEKNYKQREKEIWKYRQSCKNEALELIKKYFYNLWD